MTLHTTDKNVLGHIEELVNEEKKLYAQGEISDAERERLAKINVELDRCWDLLRQRRALREYGRDPDQVKIMPGLSAVVGFCATKLMRSPRRSSRLPRAKVSRSRS